MAKYTWIDRVTGKIGLTSYNLNTNTLPLIQVQATGNAVTTAASGTRTQTAIFTQPTKDADIVLGYVTQTTQNNPPTTPTGYTQLFSFADNSNSVAHTGFWGQLGNLSSVSSVVNANATATLTIIDIFGGNINAGTGNQLTATTAAQPTTTTPSLTLNNVTAGSLVIAGFFNILPVSSTWTAGTGYATVVNNGFSYVESGTSVNGGTVTASVTVNSTIQWMGFMVSIPAYSQVLSSGGSIIERILLPNGHTATFSDGCNDGSVRRGVAGTGQTDVLGQSIGGAAVLPTWAPSDWEIP